MIFTCRKSARLASKRRREKAANILAIAALILMGIVVMFPIYWIFRSSLMSNGELYAYPPAFTPPNWRFSNYQETHKVFEYWRFLGNTMTILVPAVIGAVITATMGG
ncbi:MAG: carbohydrate ABC transporter permease, partial [Clostridia bacterium]|nr:carbohydrate ABC transporter permease [Clostridia bacterium]